MGYRIALDKKIDGQTKYLRIKNGTRDWTPNIDEATEFDSAGEAQEVIRTIKPVPISSAPAKRIKFNGNGPSKVVST